VGDGTRAAKGRGASPESESGGIKLWPWPQRVGVWGRDLAVFLPCGWLLAGFWASVLGVPWWRHCCVCLWGRVQLAEGVRGRRLPSGVEDGIQGWGMVALTGASLWIILRDMEKLLI
jgi:hypothetical protein